MFYRKPNLLILDEPTNHMDMAGKEALEKMLGDFPGTILFVSHDRYFVSRIATGVLDFGTHEVRQYDGSYEEYLEEKRKRESGVIKNGAYENRNAANAKAGGAQGSQNTAGANAAQTKAGIAGAGADNETNPTLQDVFDKKTYYNPGKVLSRLKKQLEKYEKQLEESEAKASELSLRLMDPELASDYQKLMELQGQLDAEEHLQETLLERMMETETELQQMEQQNG